MPSCLVQDSSLVVFKHTGLLRLRGYQEGMGIELTKEEIASIVPSLQRYVREELDVELSEMRAKFLLDYVQTEIAPFAYNQGVKDAENYFRNRVEELPATCFEDGLTYWIPKNK